MGQIDREIAKLSSKLPQFTWMLLDGCEPHSPIKLNLTEERTLMNILHEPGGAMREYSSKAGLSAGAFTSVADSLEKKGLIKRVPMQGDRRKNNLQLTEKGKSTAKKLQEDFDGFIAQRISHLESRDKKALRDALRTILHTIDFL